MENTVITAPEIQKEEKTFNKNDLAFSLIFLALCFVTVSIGFFGGFRLGLTASLALDLIAATVCFGKKIKNVSFFGAFCGIAAIALTAVFTLYTDAFMNFCVFNVIIWSSAIYLTELSGTARFYSGCWLYIIDVLRTVIVTPFRYIGKAFKSVFPSASAKTRKNVAYAFAGVGLAMLFLPVIVPLLLSADVAFFSLMKRIFGDIGELIAKIIISILLYPLVMSLIFGMKNGFDDPKKAPERDDADKLKRAEPVMFSVLLSAVSVFYLIYLFSQFAYFFDAFSGFLPESYNFTYAEYARKGFFEMTAIAAINIFLIFISNAFSKTRKGATYLKAISLFICLFTEVLAATSFAKMVMYIDVYGLTKLRVLTSAFTVFIFFAVIFAAAKLLFGRFPYMRAVAATVIIITAVLGFTGVDRMIADYNVSAYQSGKLDRIDVQTLSELGDSAVPYIAELLDDEDTTVSSQANVALRRRLFVYLERGDNGWYRKPKGPLGSYNVAYEQAAETVYQNSNRIK